MTDKQIIIDGVDVSGCNYYANGKCTNSHMIQSNCKNVAVCYYKEYRRKEQECERLKDLADHNGRVCNERLDKIDELEHDINELNGQLDQLKAESKEINEKLKEKFSEFTLKTSFAIAFQDNLLNKYKQTLTEIKELLLKTPTDSQEHCVNAKSVILQKISECEVDNEV